MCGSCKKFRRKEGEAKGRAHSLAELRKIASGFAMQGLWLGDKKVGSQIIGEDCSQLLGRGTFGLGNARWKAQM